MSARRRWAAAIAVGVALVSSLAHADDVAFEPAAVPELPAARFSAKVTVLATYRRIYDVGIGAPEADLSLGVGFRRAGAVYFDAGYFAGETDGGLWARGARLGASWESPGDRLRAIVGPTYSTLSIRRATSGPDMTASLLGVSGTLVVDLARARPRSFGLALRLDAAEALAPLGPEAFVWGPSAGVFLRY